MLGEGSSRNYSFPKTFGKKATSRCRMRGNLDNVVIDVDDNVIIIDFPDTSQQEQRGSSVVREGKKFPLESIIHIDDDESHYADHSEISAEDDIAFDSDGTPRTSPAPNYMPQSEDAGTDDCGVFWVKGPAFKLSKCKNMYTNKSPPKNRYGLSESDIDPESDSSDCEVIEGSSSELREKWEKVCLKKKSYFYDKGSDMENQVSPCSSQTGSQPNAEVGNESKQNSEDPVCSRGKKSNFQEGSSDFRGSEDGFIDVEADGFLRGSKPKSSVSQWNSDASTSEQTCRGNCDFRCATSLHNERFDSCEQSPRSIHRSNKKVIGTRSCFQHSKQGTTEDFFESPVVKPNLDSDRRPSVRDLGKETFMCKDMCLDETLFEIPGVKVKDKLTLEEGLDLLDKLISDSSNEKNSLDSSSGDVISTKNDIINEREKIKETDEYKRAEEEEWAARQQQLKIQAEEAQRLKKRRKAETLRILDMERRQKQRVEEVRETQRKDEENLNIKEQLRAEIRKELYKLESTTTDMASLLRRLGIHVEGGFRPLVQEVNAAYKRALLKFHPDRWSRSDIRQQVEAEEKFKLISRMKEKLLPS